MSATLSNKFRKEAGHGTSCRCYICEQFRNGEDITKEPSQQDQVREWIEKTKKEIPPGPNPYYTPDSLVSKQKDRIKELVDAHWSYMEKVLSTGQDKQQTFTWDQVMQMRKWDYTSSAIHFYGHGYEDAVKVGHDMERQTQLFKDIQNQVKESK